MDNSKITIQEIGWGGVDWIEMGQDREKWWAFVNVVIKLSVYIKCKKYFEQLKITLIGSSRRTSHHGVGHTSGASPVTLKEEYHRECFGAEC